jgi:hypothetical protein
MWFQLFLFFLWGRRSFKEVVLYCTLAISHWSPIFFDEFLLLSLTVLFFQCHCCFYQSFKLLIR